MADVNNNPVAAPELEAPEQTTFSAGATPEETAAMYHEEEPSFGGTPEQNSAISQQFKDYDLTHNAAKAALVGAGRGVSFGLSDAALIGAGIYTPEQLQQIKDNNKVATGVGEIGGIVGTSLLAPESLLGRTVGAGVQGARAVGAGAEALSADALKAIMGATGDSKSFASLLQKTLPKYVGNAAEGSVYGLGNLVSENQLGTADFNAENIISSVGTGAILAGTAGGLFDSAVTLMPKAISAGSKIADYIPESVKKFFSPTEAAMETIGMTEKQALVLEKTNPGLMERLPNLLVEEGNLKAFSNAKTVREGFESSLEHTGKKLDTLMDSLDSTVASSPEVGTKAKDFYNQAATNIDNEILSKYKLPNGEFIPGSIDAGLKPVVALRDSYRQYANDAAATDILKPSELRTIKGAIQTDVQKAFGKVSNADRSYMDDAYINVSHTIKDEINNIADRAQAVSAQDPNTLSLVNQLKNLNQKYSDISTLSKYANKAIDKKSFLGLGDMVSSGVLFHVLGEPGLVLEAGKKLLESQVAQNMKVIIGLNAENIANSKLAAQSIKAFTSGTAAVKEAATKGVKPSIVVPPLMSSPFARPDYTGPKPKSSQEAYDNIKDNLYKGMSNPIDLIEKVRKNTAQIGEAAPQTQAEIISNTVKSMQYLYSKIPKDARPGALLNTPYVPSTSEMKKLNNALLAVERPKEIVKKFASGTATTEDLANLSAVAPNIAKSLREAAMDKLTDTKEKIPYQKRLQLETLFGSGVEGSASQPSLASLQSTFAQQQQPEATAGVQPSSKGSLSKMKPKNIDTPLQNVLNRAS